MLRSIRLKDFKSFADEEVKLSPLTVFVGANAAGKSNLLDAIRLVQGLGLGYTLTEVLRGRWEAGREVWKGLRGGAVGMIRTGGHFSRLSFSWELEAEHWVHTLLWAAEEEPEFVSESLVAEQGSVSAFEVHYGPENPPEGWEGSIAGRPFPKEDRALAAILKGAHRSLLRSARNIAAHQAGFPVAPLLIYRTLESSLLLDIVPDRMRAYSQRQDQELGAEGENISSIMWSLCRDKSVREELVDWLSELCAPEIKDIDFIETELDDVMLVLVEKDGTRTPARSLSDGTLRFLGTLIALRTAPPESIVMLEEPETGLHPQRIHLLVEYLESVTRERGVQVLTTTHSPQVLQALTPETLKNAVLCARLPGRPGTLLRRFEDIPHFTDVSARSSIDHLFSTGWLERAL